MICISKQEKQSFVLNKEGRVASLTLTCQWVFLLTHLKASSDICLKIQCFHTIFLSSRCSSYPSYTLHAVPPIAISFFFYYYFPPILHPYVSILQAWRRLLPKPQNPLGELQCLLVFASFMPCPTEGCFLPVVTALRHSMANCQIQCCTQRDRQGRGCSCPHSITPNQGTKQNSHKT